MEALYWICVAIVGLLGLRHLIAALRGVDQEGATKTGQKSLHMISLAILGGGLVLSLDSRAWGWLIGGVIGEYTFRHFVRSTGSFSNE